MKECIRRGENVSLFDKTKLPADQTEEQALAYLKKKAEYLGSFSDYDLLEGII